MGLEALLISLALSYGGGIWTGHALFSKEEKPPVVEVETKIAVPKLILPAPVESVEIRDCVVNCPEDFTVRMTRETRGRIDKTLSDYKSFASTVRKNKKIQDDFIDSYNKEETKQ